MILASIEAKSYIELPIETHISYQWDLERDMARLFQRIMTKNESNIPPNYCIYHETLGLVLI